MAHAVCARAGADASPSDTHMARGPARKRGVRLSEAEASAVVDYVCTDSGSKVPLSAFGQLLRDACRDSPHEVLDTQSVRLKLRSRALLLENSGCAPSEDADWGDDEKWSTEFAKKVRSMWGKFRQNGSYATRLERVLSPPLLSQVCGENPPCGHSSRRCCGDVWRTNGKR